MTLNGMSPREDHRKLIGYHEPSLLILEFQDRLLEFFVYRCQKDLHDISLEQRASDVVAILPESLLKVSADATGFPSFVILVKEVPYRPSANLDLENIELLLAARTAGAEDNVWALREDLGYFAAKMLEMNEHRRELITDI
ncbi:hypothetical protein BJ170DRAFT_590824 [Xylariales sp. AK1849]|nr:hypothetical protein BJ170DRAFT_590824 [Xylariales sp. AK1849]